MQSFSKRQKELARAERRREKEVKRAERKAAKAARPTPQPGDPDPSIDWTAQATPPPPDNAL